MSEVHPDVEAFAFLLGTWTGEGEGDYPSIERFRFGEELRFTHVGKPNIAYTQRTWILPDGRLSHAESGYWRGVAGGIELVLAHPTGVVEIETGTVAGHVIELETVHVAGAPTAKDVTALRRRYEVDGDVMRYDLWMAAVGNDLTHHLRAELHREAD